MSTRDRTAGLDADLAAVVAVALAFTALVAVLPDGGTPVHVVLGLPFVLVVPGYAVVAALYPGASTDVPAGDARTGRLSRTPALTTVERLVLTVTASVLAVGVVGILVNASPFALAALPVAVGVTTVALVAAAVASRRRTGVARPGRVVSADWVGTLFRPASGARSALTVLLAVSLVTAAGVVLWAPAAGGDTGGDTEFALLQRTSGGDYVLADDPPAFESGSSRPLYLRVDNNADHPATYTTVLLLQRVSPDGTVIESSELDRRTVAVPAGDAHTVEQPVRPTMQGDRLRLSVLLYAGDAPATPSPGDADRSLHVWITVE